MHEQLVLIEVPRQLPARRASTTTYSWPLDEATRAIGRRGIARAREALVAARAKAQADAAAKPAWLPSARSAVPSADTELDLSTAA